MQACTDAFTRIYLALQEGRGKVENRGGVSFVVGKEENFQASFLRLLSRHLITLDATCVRARFLYGCFVTCMLCVSVFMRVVCVSVVPMVCLCAHGVGMRCVCTCVLPTQITPPVSKADVGTLNSIVLRCKCCEGAVAVCVLSNKVGAGI
jgi:hypothetical protein